MKTRDILAVFNRGRISKKGMARTDVSRIALSAEDQENWMPNTLGSMSLRPGLKYHGAHRSDGALVPFIFANDDYAQIELTPGVMRIWNQGDTLLTRPTVSTTVTNGGFGSNLNDWTDADESGASSTWETGYMKLLGTTDSFARRRQEVTVSGGDASTVHGLRIAVVRGPVIMRVGTAAGTDDIFRQSVLRTGTHSISFVPNGNFWIEFSSPLEYPVLVDSCLVESGGTFEIVTPWATLQNCKDVRWDQSADVVFVACEGIQPYRIERRPNDSWSVVAEDATDGPYLAENTEPTTLTPSGLKGEITLTASRPIFRSGHIGALFRISSKGQSVTGTLTAENTYTDPIRVTGVTTGRIFQVTRSGTWVGTLTLQRSIGEVGSWEDVETYTTNDTVSYDDDLDNSIVYYRIGFNTGDFTSGSADVALDFDVGSITGVCRVTAATSQTEVSAVVLTTLGGTEATDIWAEGAWSDQQGWPTVPALFGGRAWWPANGRNYASVSDAYSNFDPDFEGDGGPINRQVGEGVINRVNWMLPLQRLIAGTDTAEYSIHSNSLDEPITPSNYNSKSPSTKGSARAPAAMADGRGYFIGRTQRKVYEIEYAAAVYDFETLDTTLLVPEIGEGDFSRIAVQQNPDLRVHAVREDGTVGVLVRDAAEDVLCWVDVTTDGFVEDVVVFPGGDTDRVFYRVRRVIDGSTVHYNEEMVSAEECVGGAVNCIADSFITGTGSITGLDHLEGKEVIVWGDSDKQADATVSGGTISGSYTNWVVGLGYSARYKSAKLAGQTQLGLSLTQVSRVNAIGLILLDTHPKGLTFGPSYDVQDALPAIESGATVDQTAMRAEYDERMIEFPGDWSTDNRLCLMAQAPYPCTVAAAVLNVDRQDKA